MTDKWGEIQGKRLISTDAFLATHINFNHVNKLEVNINQNPIIQSKFSLRPIS